MNELMIENPFGVETNYATSNAMSQAASSTPSSLGLNCLATILNEEDGSEVPIYNLPNIQFNSEEIMKALQDNL